MSNLKITVSINGSELVVFEVLHGVVADRACAICKSDTISFIDLIAMDVPVEDILDSRGFQHFQETAALFHTHGFGFDLLP